jgi:hypothetical protein
VRVLGLFLFCLAGSALADEQPSSSLTRFAYAGALATQSSFAPSIASDADPAHDAAARRLHQLRFVTAEHLLGQSLVTARTETTVPKTWRPSRSRIGQSVASGGIEPIAVLREVPVLPTPKPSAQRLAALSEPMHLLADAGPAATVASEEPATAEASPSPHRHVSSRHVHASRHSYRARTASRSSMARTETKLWKVPRWAEKMFDYSWQGRAFAYQ